MKASCLKKVSFLPKLLLEDRSTLDKKDCQGSSEQELMTFKGIKEYSGSVDKVYLQKEEKK